MPGLHIDVFCHMAAILKEMVARKKIDDSVMFLTLNTICSSLNYLSSYYTFRDFQCQIRKFEEKKTTFKGQ